MKQLSFASFTLLQCTTLAFDSFNVTQLSNFYFFLSPPNLLTSMLNIFKRQFSLCAQSMLGASIQQHIIFDAWQWSNNLFCCLAASFFSIVNYRWGWFNWAIKNCHAIAVMNMAEYYKVFNSGCPSIQGNRYSHNPFRLAEITRSSFPKRGQSNLREFVNELFQSDWRFQAVPPMEASHNWKWENTKRNSWALNITQYYIYSIVYSYFNLDKRR